MAVNPLIPLSIQTPDVGSAFSNALMNVQRYDAIKQAADTRQKTQAITDLLSKSGLMQPQTQQQQMLAEQTAPFSGESAQAAAEQPKIFSQDELIAQAKKIDPILAQKQIAAMGFDEPTKLAEASRFAAEVKSLPYEAQNKRIQERIQSLSKQGRNPSDTADLLNMTPAQRAQALQGIELLDLSTKDRLALQQKSGGKIGTYNPRDYTTESFTKFAATGDPSVLERYTEKTIDIGGVPHRLVPGTENQYEPITPVSEIAKTRSKIEKAITTARETAKKDVELKMSEFGQEKTVAQADAAYKSLSEGDLDKIYGFGESIYPDFLRSETGVTLQARRDQLVGLLKLAGRGQLKGQGTITDAEQATVAQAATILSNPNISPKAARAALDEAMGIIYRSAGKEFATTPSQTPSLPPTNKQGWQLMTDANGNKAYVGPNGEIEEVQ